MYVKATEYYYQKKIEMLEAAVARKEAKIIELQEKLAQVYPQSYQ